MKFKNFIKNNISVLAILIMLLVFISAYYFSDKNYEYIIVKIISPTEFVLNDNTKYSIKEFTALDTAYTEKNAATAKKLGITEDEAFILGNLGLYWTKNILDGRKISINKNGIVYTKFVYNKKFINTPFCFTDNKPTNKKAFERELNSIRKGHFVVFDLDTNKSYPVSIDNLKNIKNYIVVRKNHIKNSSPESEFSVNKDKLKQNQLIFDNGNIKIILSDLTTKTTPDRDCSSNICREILTNINNAKSCIDMAIYGYSSTPKLEEAIQKAISRGVKIRMVYDIDSRGNNIYPDTEKLTKLITDTKNDSESEEVKNTMHDKFYIFDKNTVITGSANLSHTDMSGYNSNAIIVIKSSKIAQIYTDEFNQMFDGKFHNSKLSTPNKTENNLEIYFSPQDKPIQNKIIPLIRSAEKYIYIPTFVITEKRITNELIHAQNRGVEVKIIADALNASTQHSKHKELRNSNIKVKAENYAGKMHSKTIIIDDKYLVIGSMNLSNSGENKNDENIVVLKDKAAAEFYRKFFEYQWNRIPDRWLKYTPRAEGKDSIGSCSDGIDNNYDGKTDKEDIACKG